ncbi:MULTISPECIES: hypothetical protein [unclassified Rhizobium]|nr:MULTISPECIES: hypothetical protein [unclassified Rhizobium]
MPDSMILGAQNHASTVPEDAQKHTMDKEERGSRIAVMAERMGFEPTIRF